MLKRILTLLILLLLSQAAFAALDPTKIGLGARTIGLGRVAVALPGDVNALFINPANAAQLEGFGVSSMYTNLSEDISYAFLGLANPYPIGTFGIAYLGAGSSGFVVSTIESDRVVSTGSSFDYASSVLALVYGKEFLKDLSLGATLKLYNRSFTSVSGGAGSGMDMDIGLLWKFRPDLALGLSQQNTLPSPSGSIRWGTDTVEGIPFNTKFGFSYFPADSFLLACDFDYARDNPLTTHVGVEWKLREWFALRGGMDQLAISSTEASSNFCIGIGLKYDGFSFDYAYYYDTLLAQSNSAHYFGFTYQLSAGEERAEKDTKEIVRGEIDEATLPFPLATFSDVPKDYWAAKSIGILGALKIMGGYPDGTFKPENKLTRAELAVMLVKAKGTRVEEVDTTMFSDLPVEHWASPYVKKVLEFKWFEGYPDGTFKPKKEITRAEVVSVLARFDDLKLNKPLDRGIFRDLKPDHWSAEAVQAAYDVGIIDYLKGKPFVPNFAVSRAEAATMISRTSPVRYLLSLEKHK